MNATQNLKSLFHNYKSLYDSANLRNALRTNDLNKCHALRTNNLNKCHALRTNDLNKCH